MTEYRVAVLIPCYNEAPTIAKVIQDFKRELPSANLYVYDNNSTDETHSISLENGAIVRKEYRQGKGNVVCSMFRDIEADVYLMVDGDDTYPAECCHAMIEQIIRGEADMVVGDRLSNGSYDNENKRAFHSLGNRMIKSIINFIFHVQLNDIMSGYRCFSHIFVKTIPVLSPGFEIETEMTLHALDKRFLVKEIPIAYRDRPVGSYSKLNTISDGYLVLRMLFMLFKNYRPFPFFAFVSLLLFLLGLAAGAPAIHDYLLFRFVYHVPMAILATGIMIFSALSFFCGLILDTVVTQYRCLYELQISNYLALKKHFTTTNSDAK